VNSRQIIVVGGGAAGFFAAIAAAEAGADVTVLEKSARFLDKVRISGGGRCNVTHACFEPREFSTRYPRGGSALLSPFSKFSARDTVAWFEARGVKLKTENDGRMFPVTDSSEAIVNCLFDAAKKNGVKLRLNCAVESVVKSAAGKFELTLGTERRRSGRKNLVRQIASRHRRLSCGGGGAARGFTRPRPGAAGAVAVHVSNRIAVVAFARRGFG
jgi:predicted Rossmann fold flavoprotein